MAVVQLGLFREEFSEAEEFLNLLTKRTLFSEDYLEERVEAYETLGYSFFQEWAEKCAIPCRVKIPSGKIYDRDEFVSLIKKSSPDKKRELELAMQYYDLVDSEGFIGEKQGYPSFENDADEKEMHTKYSNRLI